MLGKKPVGKPGFLEGPIPDVVIDTFVLGVPRRASQFFDGRNHVARFGHGNYGVLVPMKCPDRHRDQSCG